MTATQLMVMRIAVVGAVTAIISWWMEAQFKKLIGK